MSISNINSFKANIAGGGARANQFEVRFTDAPAIGTAINKDNASYLCKATSLPGQTITEVPVPFRGRTLYLAGDREFETWTTTFINETNFDIRTHFEKWLSAINDVETSVGLTNFSDYSSDMTVVQLDRDNNVLKSYVLTNCWPTVVAPIELSYDTTSEVETFDITWRYTHFSASSV